MTQTLEEYNRRQLNHSIDSGVGCGYGKNGSTPTFAQCWCNLFAVEKK